MSADRWARHRARHAADCIRDCYLSGLEIYWNRRADALEWAKPKPSDFHGRATRAELSAQWQRLDEAARMCRHRAQLAKDGGAPWEPEPTAPA